MFSPLNTEHSTARPVFQIEQPVLGQLSYSLYTHLSSPIKWGYFLSSTSSRQQLAREWLRKLKLGPDTTTTQLTVGQYIRTIPIKFFIQNNFIVEPGTSTQIVWQHYRVGYPDLEVHLLTQGGAPPTTFTAPYWCFDFKDIRPGSLADTTPLSIAPHTPSTPHFDPWQLSNDPSQSSSGG